MFKNIVTLVLTLYSINSFSAQEIWFSPNKSNDVANPTSITSWENSRKKISVYSFYYQVILQSTPENLKRKLTFLRQNGIKIAIEFPGLTWVENGVGYRIEGFQKEVFSKKIIAKFQSISEKPDYIILDEPFYFGHVKKGSNYPSYDQLTLAEKIKENIDPLYKVFPEIKVGEVEPINKVYHESSDFSQWPNTFYEVTGKNIAFIHADVTWGKEWRKPLKFLANMADKNKFRYGVIFNSSDAKASEDKWMNSVRDNITTYVNSDIPAAQNIIFQSWNKNPQIIFEDANPNAFSSAILYYSNKMKY